ncbi:RNA polymerase sigma factor [Ferruginibacter yonginensis]|uniref:RNA polymerase sigma factor n=1 Tax=Ferruginibacter yonginensis TaxID=1310416 RepID=A0ABV8QQN7_9BACT
MKIPLPYQDKDDQWLLQNYLNSGDNEWLGHLLQRYTTILFGVCMKYLKDEVEAKDAVQQIFLKVINEVKKYKVDYFKSWLYMIAKNYCLMQLRASKKTTYPITDQFTADDELANKNNIIQKEQSLQLLEKALQQLNEEQQVCVTLFYLQKKSYQQIIEATNYSAMQVKSNIQNGKRNLKIIMQRLGNHE